jgi:hypothetical protein
MLKQTITWTALPNGVDGAPVAGSTVRVSAFVAPRLWNDQSASTMKLSQFPDFLDWPAVVRGATFKVTFAGGPTLDATVTSAAPESDLWGELFKSDTDVVPFEFEDLSGAQIQTFSAGDAHEAIIDTYQNAATNPDYHGGNRMPDTDDLVEDPGLVDFARPVRPEPPYDPGDMGRHPVPEIPPSGPTPSGGLGCLVWPFAFLIALVRRILKWLGFPVVLALLPLLALIGMPLRFGAGGGGGGGRGGGGSPRGPPSARRQALDDIRAYLEPTSEHSEDLEQIDLSKIFDFHRMVASLGDYPVLLRRMGLVIDLAVTVPAGGLPGTGTARIAPTVSLSTTTTGHEPVTHYELAEGLFVARPREPGKDLANGLFRLQDSTRFEVHQVDVVGSAVKLQNTATNLVGQRTLGTEPVNSPDQQGLPALQTAGISVVRPNVRSRLQEIFRRMYALNRQLAAAEGRPCRSRPANLRRTARTRCSPRTSPAATGSTSAMRQPPAGCRSAAEWAHTRSSTARGPKRSRTKDSSRSARPRRSGVPCNASCARMRRSSPGTAGASSRRDPARRSCPMRPPGRRTPHRIQATTESCRIPR